ncbi:MAG TPA: SMP-30/gluconolactonase/LRE family protein, partial [Usitatibacter sp.]|nr:SMP-30/gluconolactonase/LRE family protein [Usitatibacter sp.]
MFDRRSAVASIGAAMGAVLLAMASGCATAPAPQKETRMVWPPAPQEPRIKFVRTISSERDLTTDTTFTDNLAAFLTGEKMPSGRIAEPAGLAVSDDGQRLYVSDMMQQAVFRFDFTAKKFTKFGDVGVPSGIALDARENLYVVDTARKAISIFGRDGKQVKEFS